MNIVKGEEVEKFHCFGGARMVRFLPLSFGNSVVMFFELPPHR